MALVGEPASGSVDHFGSVRSGQLPNSGLRLGVSSKYIDLGELLDADAGRDVESLEPDVKVAQTMADTLAGRDSVVEWLLAHPPAAGAAGLSRGPLTRGGWPPCCGRRLAVRRWRARGSLMRWGSSGSSLHCAGPGERYGLRNGGRGLRGGPACDTAGGGRPAPPHRRTSGCRAAEDHRGAPAGGAGGWGLRGAARAGEVPRGGGGAGGGGVGGGARQGGAGGGGTGGMSPELQRHPAVSPMWTCSSCGATAMASSAPTAPANPPF